MIEWLLKNKEWVFSGVGVAIISVIFTLFFKKSRINQTHIKTKGDYSPGQVHNYTVNQTSAARDLHNQQSNKASSKGEVVDE